jgi:hypothetical protein
MEIPGHVLVALCACRQVDTGSTGLAFCTRLLSSPLRIRLRAESGTVKGERARARGGGGGQHTTVSSTVVALAEKAGRELAARGQ